MKSSLTEQLTELKAKVESLSAEAALVPGLNEQLTTLLAEKEAAANTFTEKDALIASLTEAKTALEAEKATLAEAVAALEAEKKATSEQALEIVAGLGLKTPVVVDVAKAEQPSAADVRAKYAELQQSNSLEAARYFAENKETLLNGFRS